MTVKGTSKGPADPDRPPPSEGETGSERESPETGMHEGVTDVKEGAPGVSGEEIQRQAHEHDPAEKGPEKKK